MTAPTEDEAIAFERHARAITYAWMRHLGYDQQQIEDGDRENCHDAGCEYLGGVGYYQHIDEDEQSLHPMKDALEEASEMVCFVLEHLDEQL